MTKAEFDRIVQEAVDAGAERADAELHVVRGFHIPVDENGSPIFEESEP